MRTALLIKILIIAMIAAMVTLSVVGSFVVASQSEFSIIAPKKDPPTRGIAAPPAEYQPGGPVVLPKYRGPDPDPQRF